MASLVEGDVGGGKLPQSALFKCIMYSLFEMVQTSSPLHRQTFKVFNAILSCSKVVIGRLDELLELQPWLACCSGEVG